MKNGFLSVVAVAIVPACASAQAPCTPLTGIVHDSSSALIPGATLKLDGDRLRQQSGSDGRYRFDCVSGGPHRLIVHMDGFADAELAINLPHSTLDVMLAVDTVQTVIDVRADGEENTLG